MDLFHIFPSLTHVDAVRELEGNPRMNVSPIADSSRRSKLNTASRRSFAFVFHCVHRLDSSLNTPCRALIVAETKAHTSMDRRSCEGECSGRALRLIAEVVTQAVMVRGPGTGLEL